jgi:uncharacterized protein
MRKGIIIDTGVLVAFMMPSDKFHQWAVSSLTNIQYPVLTCEAVITEVCFLLQRVHGGREKALQLVKQGYIEIPFRLCDEIESVEKLMQRYDSVPISLADACLVRMSEILCADLKIDITEQDIAQARQEMWGNFPRDII